MIGETLAHYRIVEKIGAGGTGDVCRAIDQQLDRDVAIKLLPEAWSRDSLRVRRFEREETFFELFRATLDRVRNVRCVFSDDERDNADFALERHISESAPGDRFSEDMIVADAVPRHMLLKSVDVLLPQVQEVVRHATE